MRLADKFWKDLAERPPRKYGWMSPEPHTDYSLKKTDDDFYENFSKRYRDLDPDSFIDILNMFGEAAQGFDEGRFRKERKGTLSLHGTFQRLDTSTTPSL